MARLPPILPKSPGSGGMSEAERMLQKAARSFRTEDDVFDWELKSDPRFLRRIEEARRSLREDGGVQLEDLEEE